MTKILGGITPASLATGILFVTILFFTGTSLPQSAVERDVREIAGKLRCPVCQNLSVADSPSALAQQMRDLIREKRLAGESPEQIQAYFVSKYGEWVLLAPPRKGLNWLPWLAPFAGLMAGGAGIYFGIRKWVSVPSEGAPEAVDPEYVEKLKKELKDYEY